MSALIAVIPALIAVGLVMLVRRGWVPRGPLAALAGVAALLAAIIALAMIVGPYME